MRYHVSVSAPRIKVTVRTRAAHAHVASSKPYLTYLGKPGHVRRRDTSEPVYAVIMVCAETRLLGAKLAEGDVVGSQDTVLLRQAICHEAAYCSVAAAPLCFVGVSSIMHST